jgi:DnaK suppressor protein
MVANFSAQFLEDRKVALYGMKDELVSQLNQLDDTVDDSGDPADRAEATIAKNRRAETFNRLNKEMTEVDSAINRINAGTYGICEHSGQPINEERLIAIPTARFDTTGQKRRERWQAKQAMIQRSQEKQVEEVDSDT